MQNTDYTGSFMWVFERPVGMAITRVGAYAVQYVDLCSEIGWDAKMKKLGELGPDFCKPRVF